MKHFRLVILSVFLLSYITGISQDERKVRLGLSINPNLAWLKPDNDGWEQDGLRVGLQYGLNADMRLFGDANYSFSTGFTIAHLGGKMSYNNAVTTPVTGVDVAAKTNTTYRLRYINIPLTIKLRTNEIGYMHYYGVFGSELGFRIKANADHETTSALGKTTEDDVNIADDIAPFRAELVIGGGLEYTISGDTRIKIGLVYHNGFTNVVKGDSYLASNGVTVIDSDNKAVKDKELRNRLNYITLNLGVYF